MTSPSDLVAVEREAALVSEDHTPEQVAEVIEKVDFVAAQVRQIKKILEEQLIDWINANGDLQIGHKRYYVGPYKRYRARDQMRIADVVLSLTQGDLQSFVEYLSASAFKPGMVKKAVGLNEFDELYETVIRDDVKTGKPKKGVHTVDTRFLTS